MARQTGFSQGFSLTCGVVSAFAILFVGALLACGGCLGVGMFGIASSAPEIARTVESSKSTGPRSKLTLGNFYRVQTGMTLEEVTEILGDDCELVSEGRIAKGTPLDIHTAILMWRSNGVLGGNCNVTFQNGRVVGKAQFGLTGPATKEESASAVDDELPQAEVETAEISPPLEYFGREFIDKSGNYKTRAELVKFNVADSTVTLRKQDGTLKNVKMSSLSDNDQNWIRAELKRRAKKNP